MKISTLCLKLQRIKERMGNIFFRNQTTAAAEEKKEEVEAKQKAEEEAPINCRICEEEFDEEKHCPRILRCGHTLCTKCTDQMIIRPRDIITCPFCNILTRIYSRMHELPKNFALLEILNFYTIFPKRKISIDDQSLKDKQIDINKFVCYGETPLILAASFGDLNTVKELLKDKQILINKPTPGGFTALMMASLYGHLNVVDKLLECEEIDFNFQNCSEWTALLIAKAKKHSDIVDRLERFELAQIIY